MNSRNFMHFVLIAALFFSQLAASVHVAGHLHDHEHNCSSIELHQCAPNGDTATTILADISEYPGTSKNWHAHKEDYFTNDCKIYHTYLSLSGCLSSAPPDLASQWRSAVNVASYVTHVANLSADNRRIRGPPPLS